jgi:beta-galactosidase
VQSTKYAGEVTVQATSTGLRAATPVTISSKGVQLRPQLAAWEHEIPMGPGISGMWRPEPVAATAGRGGFGGGGGVYTFRQNGNTFTGTIEGAGGRGGGSESPVAIENGEVDGTAISFAAGGVSYTGAIKGEVIEIQRAAIAGRGGGGGSQSQQPAPAAPRPAIGPPPNGVDPSNIGTVRAILGNSGSGAQGSGHSTPAAQPIRLRRAIR